MTCSPTATCAEPVASMASREIICSTICHYVVVVGVGLVAFQQGELRVVVLVDAFVAKDPANLVDLVEPAHNQPLQVQFGGNAQVELLVQGVVVGDEWPCVGAGGHRHQHRRINLQKAALVEEPPECR